MLDSVCRNVNDQVNFKVFVDEAVFVDGRDNSTEPSIYVYFEGSVNDHRNHVKFDGPRGVLAHAEMDGDELCFDSAENWTDKRLACVALHELMHNLGVEHNDRKDSVMNPHYKGQSELRESDIKELYSLFPFMKLST